MPQFRITITTCSRSVFMAVLWTLVSLPAFSADLAGSGEDVETSRVADGVYVFRWGVYRNMFVVTDEGVIATDPLNAQAAQLLMNEIRMITDQPVRYVVYSHQHWDHVAGGKIFKKAGAMFVSQENCLRHFKRRRNPDIVMPDIVFSDRYQLALGGKTVELQYFGPNHGDCLITMRLPDEKLLFIVDIVTPKRIAFRNMPDDSPPELIRTLREIEQLEFDAIIPGHGPDSMPPVSPGSAVREAREYLEALMAAVKSEWDKGNHDLARLQAGIKLPAYRNWQAYDDWLAMNVERIWAYYHMGW